MTTTRAFRLPWLATAGLLAIFAFALPLAAQGTGIEVISQSHQNRFPDAIDFSVQARSESPIQEAIVFYSVSGGAGNATNRGVAEFSPTTELSTTVKVETGNKKYLPPGTTVTYWWELKNAAGQTQKTESQTFTYDDPRFKWQSVEKDGVTVYWYDGSRSRAEEILDASLKSAQRLATEAGVEYNHPMKIWVYANKPDMDVALPQTSATYQERTVTLGVRLSSEVMALLGNHPEVIETVAHEVSHMVIHQAIENPFGQLPAWLDEGLAMYAQGELPSGHRRELERARDRDELLSVRSLTSYVGDPTKVNLFYAQSFSIVDYLIDTHGRTKMNELLSKYKEGTTDNAALETVYGFDVPGLDQRWRDWIGAKPRPTVAAQANGTPQAVPTLSLFTLPQSSGGSPAAAPAATSEPAAGPTTAARAAATPAPQATVAVAAAQTNDAAPRVGLVAIGGLAALVVILGAILFFARRSRTSQPF